MRASDVMTTDLITVTPETSIHDLAVLLCGRGISGVPVVSPENELIGVVSETDLLHRAELGTHRSATLPGPRRVRWFDRRLSDREIARKYLKSHARTVGDVMTRGAITVSETASLAEIADLLETKRIRRVPVVRDGKLVGIISRANLVRALASATAEPLRQEERDDIAIRDALLAELRGKEWAKVWDVDVMVRDKVVHIWCADDQPVEERDAIRVAAENTPSVEKVEVHVLHVSCDSPL